MAQQSSSSRSRPRFRDAILGLIAGLYLPGLGAALYFHVPGPVVVYLAVTGAIIIAALMLERGRYRASAEGGASWPPTGERFRDPVSNRLMEVRSDPRTGKRAYVETPEGEARRAGGPPAERRGVQNP